MKYTFLFPQFSHFQERGRGEKRRRRQTNTSIRGKEGERPLYYPLVPKPPTLHFGQEQTLFGKPMPECFLRVCEIFDHGRVWKLGKKRTQCNPVLFRLVAKSHKSCSKKQHYSNLIAAKSLERKKSKKHSKNGGINFSIVKRGYTSPTAKREKWGEGNRCFLLAFSSFPFSSRGNDKRRSVSKSEEGRGEKKGPSSSFSSSSFPYRLYVVPLTDGRRRGGGRKRRRRRRPISLGRPPPRLPFVHTEYGIRQS